MDGPTTHLTNGFVALPDPRRQEHLLEALKTALHAPGEHRLFQSGKLAGLFPSRAGLSAEAAAHALREGLLETVRTEVRGKVVTEWVCATPKAVGFLHDHDSAKSILRELKDVLRSAGAGVPAFLAEARADFSRFAAGFEARASELLARLDDLAKRCESTLRRMEAAGPILPNATQRLVPWAVAALEYLDQRAQSGASGECPLPELFHAVQATFPPLELPAFHDGIRRLHDLRAVRLVPTAATPEPEYAVVVDSKLMYAVSR
ncbi:MAG: hypothetical protein K2V38_16280 [Gemmataceae bacterium]|nr:hypothetical protein [Gemmataceae bacterium]